MPYQRAMLVLGRVNARGWYSVYTWKMLVNWAGWSQSADVIGSPISHHEPDYLRQNPNDRREYYLIQNPVVKPSILMSIYIYTYDMYTIIRIYMCVYVCIYKIFTCIYLLSCNQKYVDVGIPIMEQKKGIVLDQCWLKQLMVHFKKWKLYQRCITTPKGSAKTDFTQDKLE